MSADLHHLAAAYALDALDGEERREFEAHYPTCSICSAEVTDYRATAGRLAEGVSAQPPEDLKARVLGEVGRTRQVSAMANAGTVRGAGESGRPRVLLAAAALLAAVVGGVLVGLALGPDSDVADLVAAPDAVVTTLHGTGGQMQVVWSDERDQVALLGSGLADPGADKAYALWFLTGDGVTPAGLFTPADGEVHEVLAIEDIEATGWGVTIEPDTGSDQPTTDVILSGELST